MSMIGSISPPQQLNCNLLILLDHKRFFSEPLPFFSVLGFLLFVSHPPLGATATLVAIRRLSLLHWWPRKNSPCWASATNSGSSSAWDQLHATWLWQLWKSSSWTKHRGLSTGRNLWWKQELKTPEIAKTFPENTLQSQQDLVFRCSWADRNNDATKVPVGAIWWKPICQIH